MTLTQSRDEQVKRMLADINNSRGFVLSAVKGDFGEEIEPLFDLAIYLSAPKELRIERIKQREIEKFGDRVLDGGDMYEQQQKFIEFVATRPLSRIEQWAKTLMCPVIRVDGTKDYKKTAANIADFYTTRLISIGLPSCPKDTEIIKRISARGVCVRDGKALMIKYKWPGYGFAGGGIETGETPQQAVKREMREEIGCNVTSVGELLISVTERELSEACPGKYFEQVNLYYKCEVADGHYTPNPTPEEVAREYESIWVNLREALWENEKIPQRKRDVAVLKLLLEAAKNA